MITTPNATHHTEAQQARIVAAREELAAAEAATTPVAQYPSYRYHATELPVLVHSADDPKASGKGWHTTPVPGAQTPTVPLPVLSPERIAEIQAEADAKVEAERKAKDKPTRDAQDKIQAEADAKVEAEIQAEAEKK